MNNIIRIGIACLVARGNRILLGKRKNAHGEGTWSTPGGHLEFGEQITECAKRELLEETGLIANHVEVLDFVENLLEGETKHYVTFFVRTDTANSEPRLLEPEKCEGWQWFPIDELPTPLFETIPTYLNKRALEGSDPFKRLKIVQSAEL